MFHNIPYANRAWVTPCADPSWPFDCATRRMAEEEGAFDFADVVASLNEKLIRRHPHVFGDAKGLTPREVEGLWERIKTQERMQKPKRETGEGALAGVPVALPALTRALKLQVKAGRVGFDWNDAHAVLDKIREEISE